MLYVNDGNHPARAVQPGPHVTSDAVWLDLVSPTEAERAVAERITGLRVPSLDEVSEIENSSRVYTEGDAAYLSLSSTVRGEDGHSQVTPVGFVLSNDRLLTLRYQALPSFETFARKFDRAGPVGSYEVFVGLAETIVDRMADALEQLALELTRLSKATFRSGRQSSDRNQRRTDQELRSILTAVGECGDVLGDLRDSVLGMSRIVAYSQQIGELWTPESLKGRIQTLRQDIASLNDYDQQLSNKVNFLLDAVLGFISIEQNNGVKVLTIASVVGIPPTFVVGLYGMNFKNMPELNWTYGYEFGWAMIIVSIIVPLVWFRLKGWV